MEKVGEIIERGEDLFVYPKSSNIGHGMASHYSHDGTKERLKVVAAHYFGLGGKLKHIGGGTWEVFK